VVRTYARVAGTTLLLLGIAGLLADSQPLLGVLNVDPGENIIHLLTGTLLAYEGFLQRDEMEARIVVFALGLFYLLVGLIGFVVPNLFGLLPSGLSIIDDLIHLTLGASGVAAAELSRPGGRKQGK
jgi:preprotein translocase subunit Sss1